jgi:hypothetical protein
MRRLNASLGGLITPCSYMFAPYPVVSSCLGLIDDFLILTSFWAQKKYAYPFYEGYLAENA